MATKDEKEIGQLGYKLKIQSASPVNELTEQSEEYSAAVKSLKHPSLSYLEYEKLPKEVVDNVLQTNLCCLKALLHYSGFELLSENPDLEIQCRLCKMKLKTDDDKYDLDRPKNKMRCENSNHTSLETIVFNHLQASRSKAQKENESSSELSTILMSEGEREEALESYETNIFTHKEALELIIMLLKTREKLQAELQKKTLELEEKKLVIKEQDSELKKQNETIVQIKTEYTNLEKATIPKWSQLIQEREDYQVTIQKLTVIAEDRGKEILRLTERNASLDQMYQDSKKHTDFLYDRLTKEEEKCAGLEVKNQTLEEELQRLHISSEGNEQSSIQEVNVNQKAFSGTSRRKKKNNKKSEASGATKLPDQTNTTRQD